MTLRLARINAAGAFRQLGALLATIHDPDATFYDVRRREFSTRQTFSGIVRALGVEQPFVEEYQPEITCSVCGHVGKGIAAHTWCSRRVA